jgi:hypothetical protein
MIRIFVVLAITAAALVLGGVLSRPDPSRRGAPEPKSLPDPSSRPSTEGAGRAGKGSSAPHGSNVVPAVNSIDAAGDARPAVDGGSDARDPGSEESLAEFLCPSSMALVAAQGKGAYGKGGRPERGFCIDRHEYPNLEGTLPAMMLTFELAESACQNEGKRLCTDAEWTRACEGPRPNRRPKSDPCNFGPRAGRPVPVAQLWEPRSRAERAHALDGRWLSEPRACRSDQGAFDLLGNVAEWVRVAPEGEAPGGLKGGDFTSGAVSCESTRRIQTTHYGAFAVGARCCADLLTKRPR